MKDDKLYLSHISECIDKIATYTKDGKEAFMADEMIRDAVLRNLEVIGEAVGKVSLEYRRAHPEIAWRNARELRNVLIHNYMGINTERVWSAITNRLPAFKAQIDALLAASTDIG